jgi:hypothetical protein
MNGVRNVQAVFTTPVPPTVNFISSPVERAMDANGYVTLRASVQNYTGYITSVQFVTALGNPDNGARTLCETTIPQSPGQYMCQWAVDQEVDEVVALAVERTGSLAMQGISPEHYSITI